MRAFLVDLRHAARRLGRSPTLVVAIVGTLTLTIGATVAVYGVVHRVVLRPLPFPEADRIVWLDHAGPGIGAERGLELTTAIYHAYRASTRTMSHIAAFTSLDANVVAQGEPERLEVTSTTSSFATTLGVAPRIGRFHSPAEDLPGAAPVAVLAEGFWMRRFGGDRGAVGRMVSVNGVDHEIIGVMPGDVVFPSSATAIWTPLALDPTPTTLGSFSLKGIGRLATGASADGVARELATVLARLPESIPEAAGLLSQVQLRPLVAPLKDQVIGDVRRTLWILLGAAGFVLLTGAANITGLFMVRAEARQRELAVRVALGAGRTTLLRHAFAESLLLSVVGGVFGAVFGGWLLGLLRRGSANLPRHDEIGMDATIVGVTAAIVAIVAFVFALPPWLQRMRISSVLRESGRGLSSTRQRTRVRSALVGGQVALAVVLMIGAGLMLRTFWAVRQVHPGFDANHVVTFGVGLSPATHESRARAVNAHQALLARLGTIPGVESVGLTSCLPYCGRWSGDGWRAEDRPLAPDEPPPVAATRVVSAGFLGALGVPIVAGRPFEPADETSGTRVVVISRQLAHRLWPGQDAVGRRISNRSPSDDAWYTVIGVVANTPIRQTTEDPAPAVYLPLRAGDDGPDPWQLAVVMRTRLAPEVLAPTIRREVAAIDPTVPVAHLQTMTAVIDASSARLTLATLLLGGAAAVALLLGILGVYGVVAFIVARRLPEFGLRLALGASRRDIVAMLVRQGARMVGTGLLIGLAGALALSGVMRALLYGVAPGDPATFGMAAGVLVIAGLVAVLVPSRRAARVDPSTLLRSD